MRSPFRSLLMGVFNACHEVRRARACPKIVRRQAFNMTRVNTCCLFTSYFSPVRRTPPACLRKPGADTAAPTFRLRGRVIQRPPDQSRLLGHLKDLLNGIGLLHAEDLIDFGAILQYVLPVFGLHLGARSRFALQRHEACDQWRIP